MLRSSNGLRSGVGRSRPAGVRPCMGLRANRPVRQPRLGVCAFKDWFNGLVQQQKEPNQQQQQPQQSSQTAVQEPLITASPQAPPQPAPKSSPKRDFLEARQVSLFQLFDSSDYKFDIPTYQRPYAWQTKQMYELLQDFVKAYESRQEYFLGAIVATRAADGADAPYQLIDGQQRMTSLVLLLAFLHGWAREQGNEVLEGRIRRMLYLEADPLESGSDSRYRLRLRDADDEFFRDNFLDSFLPHEYRLEGLAAAAAAAAAATEAAAAAAGGGGGRPAVAATEGAGAAESTRPLENETWWRLYENASFLRVQLDKLVAEGLNLQDFAFHVLRNCFVVLMVARDEGASFRIFSTLNGRGMDLSVVDKLKADLLAGDLTPAERTHYSGAWSEMESVLGRSAFHRVFDYMRELAAVRDPRVRETSVLEYFTRRVDDPAAVKQVLQVSLDYARLLLQLRQASWTPPELAALMAETPSQQHEQEQEEDKPARSEAASAAVQAVLEQVAAAAVLAPEDEGLLLERLHEQHRQWQQDGGGAAAVVEAEAAVVAVVGFEEPALAAAAEEKYEGLEAIAEAVAPVSLEQDVDAAATSASPVEEEGNGVVVFRFDDREVLATTAADDVIHEPDQAERDATLLEVDEVRSGLAEVSATAMAAAAAEVVAVGAAVEEALASSVDPLVLAVVEADAEESSGQVVEMEMVAEAAELAAAATAVVRDDLDQQVPGAFAMLDASVAFAASSAAAALEELRGQLHQQELIEEQQVQQQQQQTDPQLQQQEGGSLAAVVVAAVEEEEDQGTVERRRQAALLAELEMRSRHLNLFSDEAWLPPLLEFFYQTDDLEARAAFMKGAEALQLLLELQGDPAAKAARWGEVAGALLQRPFRPETVLGALRMSDAERETFRARLDSKDLYGTADQRTLRHLLVRCEPPSVCGSMAAGVGGFIVERVVPQSAPEGSVWRKTRISSPCDPQSAWPELWFNATAAAAAAEPTASTSPSSQALAADDSATATAVPSYEVKYWYEVQRVNWHGKLGNLVLLPATAAGAASATAEYDAKAALWRQAGVAARLPGFTAPLVDERGRYGRFRFCYDECRQRHADMLEFLVAEFEL